MPGSGVPSGTAAGKTGYDDVVMECESFERYYKVRLAEVRVGKEDERGELLLLPGREVGRVAFDLREEVKRPRRGP